MQGDADARVDLQPHALVHERLAQGDEQLLGDVGRVLAGGHVREQHAELVTAEAGHRVGVAQRGLQPARDLLQQQVSVVVAERVVDLLEVIEVHDHHHSGLAGAPSCADRLVDPVAEQLAVREPGEGVMERLVLLGDRLAAAAVDGEQRQEQQRDRRQAEVGGEHRDRREAEHRPALAAWKKMSRRDGATRSGAARARSPSPRGRCCDEEPAAAARMPIRSAGTGAASARAAVGGRSAPRCWRDRDRVLRGR
jgi:hypothetical protein